MDRYPRMLGVTREGHEVWEDEPGIYWVDDPDDPGTTFRRPETLPTPAAWENYEEVRSRRR